MRDLQCLHGCGLGANSSGADYCTPVLQFTNEETTSHTYQLSKAIQKDRADLGIESKLSGV